jgi:hypothetical protein
MPLVMLPLVLSALSDAMVAVGRIGAFLTAEELSEPHKIEQGRAMAVEVDGDFTWETVPSAIVQAANAGLTSMRGKGSGMKGGVGAGRGSSGRAGRGGAGGGKGNTAAGKGKRRSWWKLRSKKELDSDVLPTSRKDMVGSGSGDEKCVQGKGKENTEKEDEKPFELKSLRMVVPRGAFVGVVGRVGSGKVRS